MSLWQSTLDISDAWKKTSNNEMTVQELAQIIAAKLRKLKPCNDTNILSERDEIADEFEDLSTHEEANTEDFNVVFEHLYDWADTPLDHCFNGKKVCWVKTML